MAFLVQSSDVLLQQALAKVTANTALTSISPGSIVRAITESITTELGDLYSILDFNSSLSVLSTAQGRSLDLLGSVYNVHRKTLSSIAAIDQSLGVFYFYLDTPYSLDITIPIGTKIFTDDTSAVGQFYTYSTTQVATIPAGRTRVYASLMPQFSDGVFTAGLNTLTVIDPNFTQPTGTTVRCTNPKAVPAQVGMETDDNYRIRIQQALRLVAGGTTNAIRLAGLSVNGVRDVTINDAPFGLGSVQAIVVTEDNAVAGPVFLAANNAMFSVRPVGVRLFVDQPTFVPLTINANIILTPTANVTNNTALATRVQTGILRYLNTFLVGTPLVYFQLVNAILDSVDVVQDVVITSLQANGVEILRQNYQPDIQSMLVPGTVIVQVVNN